MGISCEPVIVEKYRKRKVASCRFALVHWTFDSLGWSFHPRSTGFALSGALSPRDSDGLLESGEGAQNHVRATLSGEGSVSVGHFQSEAFVLRWVVDALTSMPTSALVPGSPAGCISSIVSGFLHNLLTRQT
jgi:hypothetical protein